MVIGYLGVALVLWIASAIFRAAKETKRNREIARINKEQAKAKLQADLMRQEWKRQQAAAKAETARLIALERESMRMAKEQERQAAQLAKHEERLMRLEQRMALAEREIAHYSPLLEDLRKQAEVLDNKVWYFESKGLPCSGAKKELEKVSEKLYRIETKVIKAEQDKAFCEKQMSA